MRGFLVERGTQGFTRATPREVLAARLGHVRALPADVARSPRTARCCPEPRGIKGPLSCLTQARYGIAWGALGAAMACYDVALDYAKERIEFDKPIAGFQLQQEKLARMVTEITQGQLLALQLGRLKDQGKVTPAQVSMAKTANVSAASEICETARTILGANGIPDEYPASATCATSSRSTRTRGRTTCTCSWSARR